MFGPGRIGALGELASELGARRAVVVSDPGVIAAGHTAKGIAALERNELGFFVCKVEESLIHREIQRPTTDLAENKYRFVRYLERTEGKTIAFIGRG